VVGGCITGKRAAGSGKRLMRTGVQTPFPTRADVARGVVGPSHVRLLDGSCCPKGLYESGICPRGFP
jgi:hypothetical protein